MNRSGLRASKIFYKLNGRIDLELQDADTVIQGHIDVWVLQAKLWLLIIEAKRVILR